MGLKRCLACAKVFETLPRVPLQNYCSRVECQRERRKLWQRRKRQSDNDYQANQLQSQRRWREAHPDYWQQYRADHPQYVERNRAQQRARNQTRSRAGVANVDATTLISPIQSGTYQLRIVSPDGVAKMDAWIVKIVVVSEA